MLTVDTFFSSHTPYFRQNLRENGNVLLACCIVEGEIHQVQARKCRKHYREATLCVKLASDGDVAQLVKRRTGTPLEQVRFFGTVSVHLRVQSHALTSVPALKIL